MVKYMKSNKKKKIKTFFRILRNWLIILLIFILGLCYVFRNQIIDYYNKCKSKKDISAQLTELTNGDNPDKLLQVHFIDVGQGDATLITYDGYAMLIDAGDNTQGTAIQKYLLDNNIDKLDYVIGTHPDADHIGGLDVIIYKFNCEHIIMPNISKDTKSYQDVILAIEKRNYELLYPVSGSEFYMGEVKFTILSPKEEEYEDINDYSVVLKMEYGDISFIFAGDAGYMAMEDILDREYNLDCDVYKVAHHGSADSYNVAFLDEMSPLYMVISCGVDNDYNHPHKEIVEYIDNNNIDFYRTDEQGNIVFYTDGAKIACITEK